MFANYSSLIEKVLLEAFFGTIKTDPVQSRSIREHVFSTKSSISTAVVTYRPTRLYLAPGKTGTLEVVVNSSLERRGSDHQSWIYG